LPTTGTVRVGLAPADGGSAVMELNFGSAGSGGWAYQHSSGQALREGAATGAVVTYTAGQRVGWLYNPATGMAWRVGPTGAVVEGSPSAGTGAIFTGLPNNLVPAATPQASGRVAIYTHANEQLLRPAYAEAWDGADVLPEQHYRGRLAADTELTTAIHLAFPWGGNGRNGSPLGNVVIDNTDGLYDKARFAHVRDQALSVYEMVNGFIDYFAKVLVDSLSFTGEDKMSVASRGLDSKLDVRIDEPAFSIGVMEGLVPLLPVSAVGLVWDASHTPYFNFTATNLLDGGISAGSLGTDFFHSRVDLAQGVRRATSPFPDKHALLGMATWKRDTQITLANSTFTTWGADNPSSWATTEAAGTAEVKQNGGAARFHRTSGVAVCEITQAVTLGSMTGYQLFAIVNVSAYVSGDVKLSVGPIAGGLMGINGVGQFIVPVNVLGGSTPFRIRCSDALTDLSIDSVELWKCANLQQPAAMFAYLAEYAGLTSSQYEVQAAPIALSSSCQSGYWTDKRQTVRQIIDRLNEDWFGSYFTKPNGVLSFTRLFNPGDMTTTATLLELDAMGPINVKDDLAPALTDGFYFAYNFLQYQDDEIVGAVTDATRALYTSPGQISRINPTYGPYHAFYAHAVGAPIKPTVHGSFAMSELLGNTVQDMYVSKKEFFERQYKMESVRAIDPGEYVLLYADRFGLATGKKVAMVSKTRRLLSPVATCKFWG
jgi:hypothetical protein